MTLKGELPQWPLLQLVLFPESLDGEVQETLPYANGPSKVFKHLVEYLSRRASEATTNVDILRRFFLLKYPFSDSICSVLCEAFVHLFLVQLDLTVPDVLGSLRGECSLEGHLIEWEAVDVERDFVSLKVIEN